MFVTLRRTQDASSRPIISMNCNNVSVKVSLLMYILVNKIKELNVFSIERSMIGIHQEILLKNILQNPHPQLHHYQIQVANIVSTRYLILNVRTSGYFGLMSMKLPFYT